MIDTAKFLVEQTGANCAFTQSDEITLGWYSDYYESKIWFDGRIQKMNSVLASMASSIFNQLAINRLVGKKKATEYFELSLSRPLAFFDCRIWQVPTLEEGANAYLWREFDCSKNSVSMAARTMFSHNELMNKSGPEMQEMMFQKFGVNWNNYPNFFKRGTYIQSRRRLRELTASELEAIPEEFRPKGPVTRAEIVELELPPMSKVTNRPGVIFLGEDPVLGEKK